MLAPEVVSRLTFATDTYVDEIQRAARKEFLYRIAQIRIAMRQELISQGLNTPYNDNITDPIPIPQNVIQEVRDSVIYDIGRFVQDELALKLRWPTYQFWVQDEQQWIKLKDIKHTEE